MLKLNSIEIHNFRSYRGTHKFKFPEADGLYFFKGETDTPLAANGAGKSTFLDAITWILYGRTTRGLKAGEVISWGAANCQGTLDVTIGKRFKIKRTQKPNNLLLIEDGIEKPVDQEELQKHLRLNYESFLYSVLNPQFGQSFFGLAPSAKLTLFADIMNLDFWLKRSEVAAKAAIELEAGIDAFEGNIVHYQGRIDDASTDITGLEAEEKHFASETAEKIKQVKLEISELADEAAGCDNLIADMAAKKAKHVPLLAKAAKQAELAEQKLDGFLYKIADVSKKRSKVAAEIEFEEKQLKRLTGVGAKCPTCLQQVGPTHLKHHKTVAQKKMAEVLTPTLEGIDYVLKSLTGEIVKAKTDIGCKESAVEDLREVIKALDTKIAVSEAKVAFDAKRSGALTATIKALKAEKNPYSKLIADKRAKLAASKKALAESTAAKQKVEAELAATSFWVKGFKRVRLFIIEQAFRSLEIEVNNCLAQLGMNDWQITFDVERENKSGGVTKGFVVFVKGPSNNEPVRWENWSGGETQRLQLAGDLGLANLIMQQAGLTNTIEIFDEPSTHLSQEGMLDLANLLHERALGEGKRIWIVDHAAITNFGDFEGIITARKTKNDSSIQYSGAREAR